MRLLIGALIDYYLRKDNELRAVNSHPSREVYNCVGTTDLYAVAALFTTSSSSLPEYVSACHYHQFRVYCVCCVDNGLPFLAPFITAISI